MKKGIKTYGRLIYFLSLLAILFFANFLAYMFFFRIDLTEDKRYTIHQETKKLLDSLEEEIYVKVYLMSDITPGFVRLKHEVREMLDMFRQYSGNKIQYEFINPDEQGTKEEVAQFQKQLYEKGIIPEQIAEMRNGKLIQGIVWPGAILNYKGKERVWQIFKRQIGYSTEENLQNSIRDLEYGLAQNIYMLIRKKIPEISFIEGHGELDTLEQYDFMRSLSEYYYVNRIQINGKLFALRDADAIVISKPDSAFSDKDKYIIDQYIMKGGKVLWLIDPIDINLDTLQSKGYTMGLYRELNIEDMLFKYGVRLNPQLIQDLQCSPIPINIGFKKGQPNFKLFPWPYFVVLKPNSDHPIVKNLDVIRTEYISSIDTLVNPNIKKTILLSTSKYTRILHAPVRVTLGSVMAKIPERQYKYSYCPVAVLLEGAFSSVVEYRLPYALLQDTNFKYIDQGKTTKMIVVADGDIAKNDVSYKTRTPMILGYDKFSRQLFGNKDFLINCIHYLVDDKGLIHLRGKKVELRLLDKKKVETSRKKWQFINAALPLLALFLLWIIMEFIRKKKYAF
ncbi:MAG: gliding motility-associated ABC transporter substrate-binding protein GldG [Bacteroidia bacterium]|nr:gliding motility-associated ABC transporter substrate-binding protein GldG [Bacteroidia bacterium]